MGITVIRYYEDKGSRWGIVKGENVLPIPGNYETLSSFLDEGRNVAKEVLEVNNGEMKKLDELQIMSPVTQPARVVCQGLNYSDHREETGSASKPFYNLFFTKADSSLTGPYNEIIRPKHVELLDYEIELGLIIGKPITEAVQVSKDNLHEYIAGLVITNDISARDVQVSQEQYFKGKSYRTFCPTGPFLYLLDEEDIPFIDDLDIKLSVNGEIRQSSNTKHLTFKPYETLTEMSELMDLSPGDVVLTGTPGGVAINYNKEIAQELLLTDKDKKEVFLDSQIGNESYLKDGDLIRSEIKSPNGRIDLGVQENRIVGQY